MADKGGRQLTLTEDLIADLCKVLENGNSIKDACALVGISESAYQKWSAIGRACINDEDHPRKPRKIADRDIYVLFVQSTTRAKAKMREDVLKSMVSFAQAGNVQAGMFLLERSDPENWGRQTRITHEYDLKQLAELKRLTEQHNIPLSDIFEHMIQRLTADVYSGNTSE